MSATSSSSPYPRHSGKGPVAAHACESCRRRKLKCDEARPRCTNCRHHRTECEYRAHINERIEAAAGDILATVSRLEAKLDERLHADTDTLMQGMQGSHHRNVPATPIDGSRGRYGSADAERLAHVPGQPRPLTVPHSIIFWPAMQEYLIRSGIFTSSDLSDAERQGTAWFIKREINSELSRLPAASSLSHIPVASSVARTQGVVFRELTFDKMVQYTEAYFNTFNVVFPVLCRSIFGGEILDWVLREGFVDGDGRGAVALYVFALGHVAIEGTSNHPISTADGQPSGIRGGSARRPPGLAIFNEARRRQATMSAVSLEKVQTLLLQAMYFQSCSHCVDFWQSITAASMACQVLIRCESAPWESPRGDMIKRAYWACVINEELFHVDLDLPKTGIALMENEIPMPHFHEVTSQDYPAELPPEHRLDYNLTTFLAMIALRKLITRIHLLLQEAHMQAQQPHSLSSTHNADATYAYGGAPIVLLVEMASQLDEWRQHLPTSVKWFDDEATETSAGSPELPWHAAAEPRIRYDRYVHPADSQYPATPVDMGTAPTGDGFNLDIVRAALRTRFYYARLMAYLPFVYKALHFPQELTPADAENCLDAIVSACNWPLTMAPPRHKKRLVPHLFAWTQNFIGVLVILRMTREDSRLQAICEERVAVHRITRAVALMLDWIHDMRQIDTIAQWVWQAVEPLFFNTTR